MKKNLRSPLGLDKQTHRRMNEGSLVGLDPNDLQKVQGGFSLRCPDCLLSSTTNSTK